MIRPGCGDPGDGIDQMAVSADGTAGASGAGILG